MTERPRTVFLPLSFMVEQMLVGMLRRLGVEADGAFGLRRCVLDLLENHRSVAEDIGGPFDLDAIEATAQRSVASGDSGRPIDREWLVAEASAAATEAGRGVVAPADVATAVLRATADSTLGRDDLEAEVELEEIPAPASIPLGFLAEQMLSALEREVGSTEGRRGPLSWMLVLCRHHRDLAADAASGDVGELEAAARRRLGEGVPGRPLDRERIVAAAVERARDAGRSAVTPADVAGAIVELAERTPSQREPSPAEAKAIPKEIVLQRAASAHEPASTARAAKPDREEGGAPAEKSPEAAPSPGEPVGHAAPRAEERVIRVFISSTFRDMQAEREELVKRVFPQLRKLCEERGVTWGEVDLRWGITEEQTRRGEVLPICLEEIRRCRPYFIGILGERYGWTPEEYPHELIDQHPWLKEHPDHSITELEILHGVLNDPEMADHAYFYIRDPAYVESLPPEAQSDYREGPTEEDIEEYGLEEAERRAEDRRDKLAALKERIRRTDFPVREGYEDPMALGELVLEDLTALIDRLYPEGEPPDLLDREAAEHEVFAASRADVYIGRQAYVDRLDAHARGDGPPLVVLGESGSGKSALLANWALGYRETHPDDLVLMHFIGASPYSADWRAMLRRVMGELKRWFDLDAEIPDEPDALRAAFTNWLYMAAARGRVVLVLDALNQLEDREGAPDLIWLPRETPENVRLVVSTLPGRPLDALQERGWPSLKVEPLRPDEREALIEEYLAQYSKALSPERVARIAAAQQAANPLYLRALLEELRVFGVHEKLDQRIGHYLDASTVPTLYEKILERYEEDYERERPGLVGEAMSLLWAARRGLSEAELLELLGSDGEPLPQAHWSPLYLAAEGSLVSRAGLVGFSHDYLRRAVRERYLPTKGKRHAAHERLADYFAERVLGPRQIDELPWQLERAGEWRRLYDLLADLDFFQAAWEADEFEVKARWAQVEANSDLRMVDAYLEGPIEITMEASYLAALLFDTGHTAEAMSLHGDLVDYHRQRGDRVNLAASLGNRASVLYARGRLDEALELHREQERLCRALGNSEGLYSCLGNQALILEVRGDLAGAMALQKENERFCRESGKKDSLQACLGNQAVILRKRGDVEGALALLEEQERICREVGNRDGLRGALGSQAVMFHMRGDWERAMALHREEERLCRELGNRDALGASLNNQAEILRIRGHFDQSMALQREVEQICRELGNRDGLQASLGNQALILQAKGKLEDAMPLAKEQERICRELGNRDGLQSALANQAAIYHQAGDLDHAMRLYEEQEHICRELGNMEGLALSLTNQAACRAMEGDRGEATRLINEAYRLVERYGLARLVGQVEHIRSAIIG